MRTFQPRLLSCAVAASLLAGCAPDERTEIDPSGVAGFELEAQGEEEHGRPEPPMLGVHGARGSKPGGGNTPNLIWRGGQVMPAVAIQPIFWGSAWAAPSFVGDKITGLDAFYAGYIGSSYARTNIEYTGTNGTVTATHITLASALVDTSPGPKTAPSTSAILAEVCKLITNPVASGYYPVYTDTPRGSAGYCAWHSWGSCGGVEVQFAFFFELDGDPGCDPRDDSSGRSQGLAALANVTGHELSEAETDPRGDGWLDRTGAENADKCAWKFDQPVALSDGSVWKVQGNWSNAAYNAGTGLPNRSGQKGCLYNF